MIDDDLPPWLTDQADDFDPAMYEAPEQTAAEVERKLEAARARFARDDAEVRVPVEAKLLADLMAEGAATKAAEQRAAQAAKALAEMQTAMGADDIGNASKYFDQWKKLRQPEAPIVAFPTDASDALKAARRVKPEDMLPVPAPWADVRLMTDSGLRPGFHVLVGGTGSGKTTLALQWAIHAAKQGHPVAYVALELGAEEVALRLAALHKKLDWAKARWNPAEYTTDNDLHDEQGQPLPIHILAPQAYDWDPAELRTLPDRLRVTYPDCLKPPFIVLDYLQLLGSVRDETGRKLDLRESIGRASAAATAIAVSNRAVVLALSTTARANYGVLRSVVRLGGLRFKVGKNGHAYRNVYNAEQLVGLGKESGEIEASATTVMVMGKVNVSRADWPALRVLVQGKSRHQAEPSFALLALGADGFTGLGDGGLGWKANDEQAVMDLATSDEAKAKRGGVVPILDFDTGKPVEGTDDPVAEPGDDDQEDAAPAKARKGKRTPPETY